MLTWNRIVAFRKQLNELAALSQERSKVSFNDFITKSCALALRQHPYANASYLADQGEIQDYTTKFTLPSLLRLTKGLVTPVIRNADQKGLGQIAEETRDLCKKSS